MTERPRWLRRLRARLGGYFWLPCPCCGRMFGGNEIGVGIAAREDDNETTFATCSLCPGTYFVTANGVVIELTTWDSWQRQIRGPVE